MDRERTKRIAVAVAIALFIASIFTFINDATRTSMVRSGDFPGFFVQGEILKRGLSSELYNFALQNEIETQYWPNFNGAFYAAVYPPYFAPLMIPFAILGPTFGQIIFTLLMFVLYFLAFKNLSQVNDSIKETSIEWAIISLLFTPIFSSLFAAQNTAFSMWMTSELILFVQKKVSPVRHGLQVSLWLLKPQFGILAFIIGLLASRCARYVFGFLLGAVVLYLMGTSVVTSHYGGLLWPIHWAKIAGGFGEQNFIQNGNNMISLASMLRSIDVLGLVVVGLVTAVVFLIVAGSNIPTLFRVVASISLIPVIAPQTLFYDLGISYLCLLYMLDFRRGPTLGTIGILYILAAVAFIVRHSGLASPFSLILIPLLALVFLGLLSSGDNSQKRRLILF